MTTHMTTEPIVESAPQDADLPLDILAQAAFTAYVDAAQAEGHAQSRLEAGAYAAARAVVSVMREQGWRQPRPRKSQPATHGTVGGYNAGCRCEFCIRAATTVHAAWVHWKPINGHNKVRG